MSDETARPARTPTLEKDTSEGDGPLRQSASGSAYAPHGDPRTGGERRARRFWSTRRVPAGVTALLLLSGAGLLLYDITAVRAAGEEAMPWRRHLVRDLSERSLDSPTAIASAVLAVLIGAWLLTLALTPGRRGLLPMRRGTGPLRSGLERTAAAALLRDRATKVPGVRSARVVVRRGGVTAWAQSHFRPLDEVRADLDATLGQGIEQLDLARRPRLRVRVRRATKR